MENTKGQYKSRVFLPLYDCSAAQIFLPTLWATGNNFAGTRLPILHTLCRRKWCAPWQKLTCMSPGFLSGLRTQVDFVSFSHAARACTAANKSRSSQMQTIAQHLPMTSGLGMSSRAHASMTSYGLSGLRRSPHVEAEGSTLPHGRGFWMALRGIPQLEMAPQTLLTRLCDYTLTADIFCLWDS